MDRTLTDLTLEELWQLFPVTLVSHREDWKDWYLEEKARLQKILPPDSRIDHTGSTAIPGIAAKPIVDILVQVPAAAGFSEAAGLLEDAGWICMAHSDRRYSFNKGYTPAGYADRVFHLHLVRTGDDDELHFRDWLQTHPADARAYEALKRTLSEQFEHDRDRYTAGKTGFVNRILSQARTAVRNGRT